MNKKLTKSFKHFYPFKICTTSFIYRDTYVPNVRMLGPYLDEIELLMFESRPDSLPTKSEIEELAILAQEHDITYNVHLPTDIFPASPNLKIREDAVTAILRVVQLTCPLTPSTYTLHLPWADAESDLEAWRERNAQTITRLLDSGLPARQISIETLSYPIDRVAEIIDAHDLAVCMDIGHLFVHGFNANAVFDRYGHRTTIIHLHGVENGQDHISLDRLSPKNLETTVDILKMYTGVVSLEVFSFDDLQRSLSFLDKFWLSKDDS
jgi:adenosylcobalamin phosphodiesterase